jgi:hypothetical protein
LTDHPVAPRLEPDGWPEIDTSVAHVARVYDYLLGGRANFEVDRLAADQAYAAYPGGLDGVRADVRAHRALLGRVVRYLAGEAGIAQFLDIGTGIPKQDNTHEVAQRVLPRTRVVYADYDPIVLAHAHQLLTSTPEGACAYVFGDLRDPDAIIRKAADTLDFARPAAVIVFGVLHFFSAADEPAAVLARLTSALAPGSYLALTHLAGDLHPDEVGEAFTRLSQQLNESVVLRSQAEVTALLRGLDLLDPGVVQLPQWRPDPGDNSSPTLSQPIPARALPMWAAVGRKR